MKKTQSGFAHFLVLVLLLAGLAGGVYLVQQQTNFLPKAAVKRTVSRPISRPISSKPTPTPTPCQPKPECLINNTQPCKVREPKGGWCPVSTPTPTATPTKTPTPTANPTPTIAAAKRVFVTSTFYNGNLGGLFGADSKCQERANTANLGGTWKAWLSDNQNSAASRLTHATVPYKQLNNVTIANNWQDLTDGSLISLPVMTELKTNYYGAVWTGTNYNGSTAIGSGNATHCKGWTSDLSSEMELLVGLAGNNQKYNYWTNVDINLFPQSFFGCNNNYALYCFEQ